jgi:AraC family transcriptional regulator of adaptative response/methylated-DNA-[protein]-cysteine methyltransferase
VTLSQLAKHTGYSSFHLQRMFKKALGISPQQYQASRRVSAFKTNLRKAKVIDAAYDSGYSSSSRVSENATPQLGMTPASYGKNGAGAEIKYAIFDSELGKVLLAQTSRGICSLKFGESIADLERGLRHEFSAAVIKRDDRALTPQIAAVRRCIAGQSAALQLPLDIQTTAFQRLVWSALRQIPAGTTRHYEAVAKSIGSPRAHRAVARACAANNVALLIPCHRVVPKSGGEGGYRWGTERKTVLLRNEGRKNA